MSANEPKKKETDQKFLTGNCEFDSQLENVYRLSLKMAGLTLDPGFDGATGQSRIFAANFLNQIIDQMNACLSALEERPGSERYNRIDRVIDELDSDMITKLLKKMIPNATKKHARTLANIIGANEELTSEVVSLLINKSSESSDEKSGGETFGD